MTCYHPLYRIQPIGARGTERVTFERAELLEEGWIDYSGDTPVHNPPIVKDRRFSSMFKANLISCGKCIGCRLDYSRSWATRIMCEAQTTENNWFLTLTYSDEYLPHRSLYEEETGEIVAKEFSCNMDHISQFMNSLRKHWERKYNHKGIRFYAVSEYGGTTQRPHYHIILFNLPIYTEMIKYKNNKNGDVLYINEEIEKIWGKGFCPIGELTWQSAAYVARYMLKKQKGSEVDPLRAREPERSRMSRMPGIGQEYYNTNYEKIYKNDEIIMKIGDKVQKLKPPKYFDDKFEEDHEKTFKKIKRQRIKIAEKSAEVEDKNSTLTRQERRDIKERSKIESVKKLKREL